MLFSSWYGQRNAPQAAQPAMAGGLLQASGGTSVGGNIVKAQPFNANLQTQPWQTGMPWLTKTLSDPYSVNEAPLRGAMSDVETAYQTARNRMAKNTLGSGAGGGGVAQRSMGNVELGRASGMADVQRQWAEFVSKLGDERLQTLLLPYLSQWNQAYGTEMQPKPAEKGGFEKVGMMAKSASDIMQGIGSMK